MRYSQATPHTSPTTSAIPVNPPQHQHAACQRCCSPATGSEPHAARNAAMQDPMLRKVVSASHASRVARAMHQHAACQRCCSPAADSEPHAARHADMQDPMLWKVVSVSHASWVVRAIAVRGPVVPHQCAAWHRTCSSADASGQATSRHRVEQKWEAARAWCQHSSVISSSPSASEVAPAKRAWMPVVPHQRTMRHSCPSPRASGAATIPGRG